MSNGDQAEAEGRGKPVEIKISSEKKQVFAEKMAKVKRVVADLTGTNEAYRNQRIGELHAAERDLARKHTLLDVREYTPMRQQVAYLTTDGEQMERAVVVYFRKSKGDMSVEYAADENGVQLAFDADLFDSAPESGTYEANDKKYRVRVYPVFGENLAIERTISMFEYNPNYVEAPPLGEAGEVGSSTPVVTEAVVVEETVGVTADETKELEEDLLTRHEELIRKNPELVAWFYQTCHGLINEKDITKRRQQYDAARKNLENGGMPGELLDLITSSSELILVEGKLEITSHDKAGELKAGMAGLAGAFGGLEKVFKEREDFLRLRIMVAESGKEIRTGDINFLGQLRSELTVLQNQVRLKKEGK